MVTRTHPPTGPNLELARRVCNVFRRRPGHLPFDMISLLTHLAERKQKKHRRSIILPHWHAPGDHLSCGVLITQERPAQYGG